MTERTDIVLKFQDYTHIYLDCEFWLLQEIYQRFEFFVPNYRFNPKFKAKLWNGKISLVNRNTKTILFGVLRDLVKFLRENNYSFRIEDQILDGTRLDGFDIEQFEEWCSELPLTKTPRDYQVEFASKALSRRRLIALSATSSGKSLSIYLKLRWLFENEDIRSIVIVPTINLVNQLVSDFAEYDPDWVGLKDIAKLYGGEAKQPPNRIVVSTWQSLQSMKGNSWFQTFDDVTWDEVHGAKSTATSEIMKALGCAKIRTGCTGTLDESKTNEVTLRGLFGDIETFSTTAELIESGTVSELTIQPIIISYPDSVRQEMKKDKDYKKEIDFIINNIERNKFLARFASSLDENVLMLYARIDNHALVVHDMLQKYISPEHKLHVFTGKTKATAREVARKDVDNDATKHHIITGSRGVISTGTNIINLNSIMFCHPTKSKILSMQSIGRVLRKGENKSSATVYDIVDDLSWKARQNHTLMHYEERLRFYLQSNLPVMKPLRINLKG